MKRTLLISSLFLSSIFGKAQTTSACPNGDMEMVSICFSSGAIFGYWSDGCTDPWVNPTSVSNSGFSAMLITNDSTLSAPVSYQDFPLSGPIPSCIQFAGKIDLNAGDTVKFKAYINCNGSWVQTADWYYTNSSQVSIPYTDYQVANNGAIMCIMGMDSMRIELIGGKVMNGATPTSFYIDDIVLDCTTGMKETISEKTNVYPNPATTEITIDLPADKFLNAEFDIYDVCGARVAAGTCTNGKIDVAILSAGVYNVEIRTKEINYRTVFCISR